MYIPKLRKKEHIMKDIKELDENTAITLYLINTMIKKGELTKINYGNAQLVNIDEIADFFTPKEEK